MTVKEKDDGQIRDGIFRRAGTYAGICGGTFSGGVPLSCEGKQLRLDSLIGILALDLHRGVKVEVIAEGDDEQDAAKAICEKIAGADK